MQIQSPISAVKSLATMSVLLVVLCGRLMADEEIKETAKPQKKKDSSALLRGYVQDEQGNGLPGARVRVGIPAIDMRSIDLKPEHRVMNAVADDSGKFQIRIPGITEPTTVSLDAMVPGFQRQSATLMRGGGKKEIVIVPNAVREVTMKLSPALYFGGIVVDEQDQPVAGMQIQAMANTDQASAGVEVTRSRDDGTFEVFNYAKEPIEIRGGKAKGYVLFTHPHYLQNNIVDVYELEKNERTLLRVVMKSGVRVAGRVLNADGRPVIGAMIIGQSPNGYDRKGMLTDEDGAFELRGLQPGLIDLIARDFRIEQKTKSQINLDADKSNIDVRMGPIELPKELKVYSVLGMKLTDATPEVVKGFDLFNDRGAVILDPGPDFEQLKIQTIEKGNIFWCVGNKDVASVKEFIEELLAHTRDRNDKVFSIRIVYSFSNVEYDGTNTQYLNLPSTEIPNLKAVLKEIETAVPVESPK